MDPQVATYVFAGIMGLGVIVWFFSLFKALQIGRETREDDPWKPGAKLHDVKLPGASTTQQGERTIQGDPEKLSKALARSMVQVNIGMFGSLFEVTERTAARVVLKKTGPLVCNQPAGLYFSEAEFNFIPLGGDAVRVSYDLGFDRLVRMTRRISLGVIFGAGLPVLLLVGTLVWFLVVQSDEPAIRWQVFQCLQIAHALWPPFMFMGMYSMGRRHSKTYVTNMLTTLELVE